MSNLQFLEPGSEFSFDAKTKEIGDYGTVTQVIISGTNPEILCEETTQIKFATLSISGGKSYVLIDNNTSAWASPSHYNYQFRDGDNWADFRLGKQRYTACSDVGTDINIRIAVAEETIVVI